MTSKCQQEMCCFSTVVLPTGMVSEHCLLAGSIFWDY